MAERIGNALDRTRKPRCCGGIRHVCAEKGCQVPEEQRYGPAYDTPMRFRAIRKGGMEALTSALAELRKANKRKDGIAAAKAADKLCDLAMAAQSHFFNMRPRKVIYVEAE
jgi:hypothetical protein